MAINMYETFLLTECKLTSAEKEEIKNTLKIANCTIFGNKLSQLTPSQLTKLVLICEKLKLHFVNSTVLWNIWNERSKLVETELRNLQD